MRGRGISLCSVCGRGISFGCVVWRCLLLCCLRFGFRFLCTKFELEAGPKMTREEAYKRTHLDLLEMAGFRVGVGGLSVLRFDPEGGR